MPSSPFRTKFTVRSRRPLGKGFGTGGSSDTSRVVKTPPRGRTTESVISTEVLAEDICPAGAWLPSARKRRIGVRSSAAFGFWFRSSAANLTKGKGRDRVYPRVRGTRQVWSDET